MTGNVTVSGPGSATTFREGVVATAVRESDRGFAVVRSQGEVEAPDSRHTRRSCPQDRERVRHWFKAEYLGFGEGSCKRQSHSTLACTDVEDGGDPRQESLEIEHRVTAEPNVMAAVGDDPMCGEKPLDVAGDRHDKR